MAGSPTRLPVPDPPSARFGALFVEVQRRHLFEDSKTFADAIPLTPITQIMAEWHNGDFEDDAALRAFVVSHFALPSEDESAPPPSSARLSISDHITALWPVLTRRTPTTPVGSSALSLPEPYVVPGGRFRELYYWDSYFTMLGLAGTGRQDLVEDMIDVFGSLIERFGHIPNGTRSYYLSRSQPPFFYLMTGLTKDRSKEAIQRTNRWLRAEHDFWMAGADGLEPGTASRRVVRLPDGALLNRYWDDLPIPRDEAWREDVEVAHQVPERPADEVYRDIRAAAESGWDFSSRWLGDGRTMSTIRTTRIVPVDLNSLMYGMEGEIARTCRLIGDDGCARDYAERAAARRAAIETHLWNPAGYYADFDIDLGRVSDMKTAAMMFPLFTGVATPARAAATSRAVLPLVRQGGLDTTLTDTDQQWDTPNGWAPLQWIAVSGLRRYGENGLADRISAAWLATVEHEYRDSGRLLEKYDVVEQRPGGGGEYKLQDGFGWTNGVVIALTALHAKEAPAADEPGGMR